MKNHLKHLILAAASASRMVFALAASSDALKHLILAAASASVLCACARQTPPARTSAEDALITTTGVISSKTAASAGVIFDTAQTLGNSHEKNVILNEAGVIATLNGTANSGDKKLARARATGGDVAGAIEEAKVLRERAVAAQANISALASENEKLARDIALLRAEAEESRKNNINWVFLAGAALASAGAAGFSLLYYFQRDRDWLALAGGCAAGVVVLPFIPMLINSLLFKIPVGGAIVAGIGWLGWQVWQSYKSFQFSGFSVQGNPLKTESPKTENSGNGIGVIAEH